VLLRGKHSARAGTQAQRAGNAATRHVVEKGNIQADPLLVLLEILWTPEALKFARDQLKKTISLGPASDDIS
jgi:hypothetical protein